MQYFGRNILINRYIEKNRAKIRILKLSTNKSYFHNVISKIFMVTNAFIEDKQTILIILNSWLPIIIITVSIDWI